MSNRGLFLFVVLFMGLAGCVTEKIPPASIYTLNPDLGAMRVSEIFCRHRLHAA